MNEPISVKDMKKCLEQNFNSLWMESFGILEEENVMLGGIRVTKDNKKDIQKLKEKINKMEFDVKKYKSECFQNFNPEIIEIMKSDLGAFKNNIFGEKLWTVSSSLHDMSNPELARYRESFDNATPKEVYVCVKHILEATKNYVENVFPQISLRSINNIEDLKLDYLDEEDMLLVGVIGLGIRSELLHRMYPAVFPIMTRRSLWGMYFLTSENEFIVDENFQGKSRTSHEWNYDYDRFCFYTNFLTNIMETYLKKYKIKMDMTIRFGYLNLMLIAYSAKHKTEIDKLYSWKYTGL